VVCVLNALAQHAAVERRYHKQDDATKAKNAAEGTMTIEMPIT